MIAKINEAPGFWIGIPMVALGGMIPVEEMPCPYSVGDRLWVREVHSMDLWIAASHIIYRADCPSGEYIEAFDNRKVKWRSPIHMPRWASRLTLEITAVSVEWSEERGEWMWVVGVEKVEKTKSEAHECYD